MFQIKREWPCRLFAALKEEKNVMLQRHWQQATTIYGCMRKLDEGDEGRETQGGHNERGYQE